MNLSSKEVEALRKIYLKKFPLTTFGIESICLLPKEKIMELIDLLSEDVSCDCMTGEISNDGIVADNLISFLTEILVKRNEF